MFMFRRLLVLTLWVPCLAFVPSTRSPQQQIPSLTELQAISRRNLLAIGSATVVSALLSPPVRVANAAPDLDTYLYKIIRVREATQQERRLISTGKFKDRARQNVKLAVKFMIQNYQLSDCIVGASAYLSGNAAQMRANDAGQAAVQNLQTILEYFDSSDVENIKVCLKRCLYAMEWDFPIQSHEGEFL